MKPRALAVLPLLLAALALNAGATSVVKRSDGGGATGGAAGGGGSIGGGVGGGFRGGGGSRVAPRGGGGEFRSHNDFGENRVRQNRVRTENLGAAGVGHTRIVRRSSVPTPQQHSVIANNTRVIRTIRNDRRVEVVPNHAYWHNVGTVRYVHYLRGGVHWYGFYSGPRFYWTRYYHNRWWWYDPFFNHWAFWWDGYWWWRGPEDVLYVDVNDTYYPYSEAPVKVSPPASEPLTQDTENNGGEFTSRDGTRMVQIHGPESEAFLYDKSGAQPQYLAYLGKNVDRVRFSGGTDGKPVRILVDFKNGDFTLFNAEGEPVDLTPPAEPANSDSPSAPSEPPSDLPALPGQ